MSSTLNSKAHDAVWKSDLLKQLERRIGVRLIIYKGSRTGEYNCSLYLFGSNWTAGNFFWMETSIRVANGTLGFSRIDFEIWDNQIPEQLEKKFFVWEKKQWTHPWWHKLVSDMLFVGVSVTDSQKVTTKLLIQNDPQLVLAYGLLAGYINAHLSKLKWMLHQDFTLTKRVEMFELLTIRFNSFVIQHHHRENE